MLLRFVSLSLVAVCLRELHRLLVGVQLAFVRTSTGREQGLWADIIADALTHDLPGAGPYGLHGFGVDIEVNIKGESSFLDLFLDLFLHLFFDLVNDTLMLVDMLA